MIELRFPKIKRCSSFQLIDVEDELEPVMLIGRGGVRRVGSFEGVFASNAAAPAAGREGGKREGDCGVSGLLLP